MTTKKSTKKSSKKTSKKRTLKPGEKVEDSGIYKGTKGGKKTTLVKGKRTPPTSKKGEKNKQEVDTNPKN
jgi:hypothetical protein